MNWPLFNTAAALAVVLLVAQYVSRPRDSPGRNLHSETERVQPNEEELEALIRGLEEENDNENDNDNDEDEDEDDEEGDEEERAAAENAAEGSDNEQARARPIPRWQRGPVSRKKAKSLAKREQRRAYFEWVRHEAEAQKANEKRADELFGDFIEYERQMRQKRIAQARKSLAAARAERQQAESDARAAREQRRQQIAELAADSESPIKLEEGDSIVAEDLGEIVREREWLITERAMQKPLNTAFNLLQANGKLSWQELTLAVNNFGSA